MTLNDAVRLGIARVRDPKWAEPTCYMKIDLIQESESKFAAGPWLHLYSPVTQKAIRQPTPQNLLFNFCSWDEDGLEAYTGEICEGDTQNIILKPQPLTDQQIEDAIHG